MFSGIVEELASVKRIFRRANMTLLEIASRYVCQDILAGDSVAVNGVCLTLVDVAQGVVRFEVMPETIKSTNLGGLRVAEKVNLERALKLGDRISGHFVSGHIDCVGIIRKKRIVDGNLSFEIAIPAKYIRCLLPKGSVAVDGISLTVMSKRSDTFSVYIIGHTFKNTTLGFKGPSSKVNLEFDLLLKR
jgi:riboflavin synthase